MPIVKATATGNDFLILDATDTPWRERNARAQWVVRWCDRHEGLGADGAVFLEPSNTADMDFSWDFFNSDGSPAEMCGNAARAVAAYWYSKVARRDFRFLTPAGPVGARVISAQAIEVTLSPVGYEAWDLEVPPPSGGRTEIRYQFVHTGVPHAVVAVSDLSDRDQLRKLALPIKAAPRFRDTGTNVTFVRPLGPGTVESVTFERGVEDFTRSCGTGAVAAAHVVSRGQANPPDVEVRVPGGRLRVLWKDGKPTLIGPARLVAEIHWFIGE